MKSFKIYVFVLVMILLIGCTQRFAASVSAQSSLFKNIDAAEKKCLDSAKNEAESLKCVFDTREKLLELNERAYFLLETDVKALKASGGGSSGFSGFSGGVEKGELEILKARENAAKEYVRAGFEAIERFCPEGSMFRLVCEGKKNDMLKEQVNNSETLFRVLNLGK